MESKTFTHKNNSYAEKYRKHQLNTSRNFSKSNHIDKLDTRKSNENKKTRPNIPKPNHHRSSSLPNNKSKSHSVAVLKIDMQNNQKARKMPSNTKLSFNSSNSVYSLTSLNSSSTTENYKSPGLLKKKSSNNSNNVSLFILNNNNNSNEPSPSFTNWINNLTLKSSFYFIPLDSFTYNKKHLIYYSEFTEIYKGQYLHLPVAIKMVPNIDTMPEKDLNLLKNEIEISISLHHPYILNTYGVSYDNKNKKVYLISEFCSHLSLKKYIEEHKNKTISLKDKIKFCYQIALAILYLHSRNPIILHRDLKSGNVFLDENMNIKLGDFGMSKAMEKMNDNYKTNSQSTPFWMAPEFMSKGIFTDKSDIYSLGILFWEIFMENTKPFENENVFDFITGNETILSKRPAILDNKINNSEQIKSLIENCWDIEPSKRPSIENVVSILEDMMIQ